MYKSQYPKPVDSNKTSPKRVYLSLAAEFKDTVWRFQKFTSKNDQDLKEDTKTEEQRKEVNHRPGRKEGLRLQRKWKGGHHSPVKPKKTA